MGRPSTGRPNRSRRASARLGAWSFPPSWRAFVLRKGHNDSTTIGRGPSIGESFKLWKRLMCACFPLLTVAAGAAHVEIAEDLLDALLDGLEVAVKLDMH
jgi:hypothetical protein